MAEETPQPAPLPANDAAPEPAKSLDDLLAEAQAKIEDHRQAWLRALADAENARKRAAADVAQARKFALERFVAELLPVIDSLEAALAAGDGGGESLRSGVELTLKLLRGAFERHHVTEVAPSPGERFDPHHHQAMTAVESDAAPNSVVALMQKGYCLHDRVIRPALVTVARSRQAAAPAPGPVENGGGNPICDTSLEPDPRN
jgi:molecular chaperone GrpE